MTTKISGYQNRPVLTGTDKTVSRTGESAACAAKGTVSGSNPVRITAQAKQLAALEQVVQGLPLMNEVLIAEIGQAIQEGRYEIDPTRIADKMLRLERELSA